MDIRRPGEQAGVKEADGTVRSGNGEDEVAGQYAIVPPFDMGRINVDPFRGPSRTRCSLRLRLLLR